MSGRVCRDPGCGRALHPIFDDGVARCATHEAEGLRAAMAMSCIESLTPEEVIAIIDREALSVSWADTDHVRSTLRPGDGQPDLGVGVGSRACSVAHIRYDPTYGYAYAAIMSTWEATLERAVYAWAAGYRRSGTTGRLI